MNDGSVVRYSQRESSTISDWAQLVSSRFDATTITEYNDIRIYAFTVNLLTVHLHLLFLPVMQLITYLYTAWYRAILRV